MMTYTQWLAHNDSQIRKELLTFKLYSVEDFNDFAEWEYAQYTLSFGE